MKTVGIILLGGKGNRLDSSIPKQFIDVNGKMLCEYAIDVFEKSADIDEVCLVCIKGYDEIYESLASKYSKIKYFVEGGSERQHSVYNAISQVKADVLIIHDGARPFVTFEEIKSVKQKAIEFGSAITALPVKDTIKKANNGLVESTINRENLFSVKTPQAFMFEKLLLAHESAIKDNFVGTDDASLIERLGQKVFIVTANDNNIKVTTNIDLIVMKAILEGEK